MKRFLGLILVLTLFCCIPVIAATVTESPDSSDVNEIDQVAPGTSKTFLGTRLRGLLQIGSTTSAECTTGVGACNNVATTETTAVTLKTTGSAWGESFALANGYSGQLKTYVLATDGGKNFTVTPSTKTGFTSVQLDDAKDSVTLRYVDSTVGWVIAGNAGATIN